jgi:6-phosphogluconolactonase
MQQQIRQFKNVEAMYDALAKAIKDIAVMSVNESGSFSLALAGGKTPLPLYEKLADMDLPWNSTDIFWGDERCTAPDDQRSNYLGAYNSLLKRINLRKGSIHRIQAELPPDEGARKYEEELIRFKNKNNRKKLFDLILLGMGEDGHTASLFPGSELLNEHKKLVAAAPAPEGVEPAVARITLTYPALADSEFVFFVIKGNNKIRLLANIENYPAGNVKSNNITWFAC